MHPYTAYKSEKEATMNYWRCGLISLALSIFPAVGSAEGDAEFDSKLKNIPVGWGTLDIGANARLRFEYFTNRSLKQYATGSEDHVLYDRLGIWGRYQTPTKLELYAEVYGAHMWLNEYSAHDFTPACGHQNTLDVRRLYLATESIAESGIGFRIGRQSIAYGDQRIWGPGSWSNSEKFVWDAAVLTYNPTDAKLDLTYARRVITRAYEFDNEHYDFHAGGIYFVPKIKPLTLHLFGVGEYDGTGTVAGESGVGDAMVATLGAYSTGAFGAFTYRATLAGQSGIYGADKVLAGAGNIGVDYTFAGALRPQVFAGYSYATGDADPADGIRNTFDGVYGAAAKYYGRMNLFFWKNLGNVESGFRLTPIRKTDVSVAYHYFYLARAKDAWYRTNGKPQKCPGMLMRDVSGKSGRELGHEIDLMVSTKPIPHLSLQAGYSHFFAGSFILNRLQDSYDSDGFFAQVQYAL